MEVGKLGVWYFFDGKVRQTPRIRQSVWSNWDTTPSGYQKPWGKIPSFSRRGS